ADPSLGPVGGIRDIDATATAEALNPVPTPTVETAPATPATSPVASPEASPGASPAAVKPNGS
ncbi:MAG: hypothetical protein WKF81_08005, partial [Thermomicrobiales bacterium]